MNQRNTLILLTIAISLAVALGAIALLTQSQPQTSVLPKNQTSPTNPAPPLNPTPNPTPKPSTPSDKATILHIALWLNTTEKAVTDRLYANAIYASRTLAVVHPEVYLKGDLLFLRSINSVNGYQKAFNIKNVTDDYFTSSKVDGPPFSLALVDFNAYKTIPSLKQYPEGYPVLPYLDRRMLTLGCTLKTTSSMITQLELAEQYYFNLKRTLPANITKFIIYCDNENAYIINGETLTSMENLKTVTSISGNPILIFNEESVWYPLMGRDDGTVNQVLQRIVNKYSTGIKQPSLSEDEKEILQHLKSSTQLDSENQYTLALLASAHMEQTSGSLNYNVYIPHWDKLGIPIPSGEGLFRVMYKVANYLSPITARLAAVSSSSDGRTLLTAISKEYTAHTATFFYAAGNVSWGHTWPCGLLGNTVDEIYRTRGSHCVWQAASLAAVLDVLGIENYVMELGLSDNGEIGNAQWHNTIYVPKFDLVLGNGVVETLLYNRLNTVVSYSGPNKPRSVVRFLSKGVGFADPFLSSDAKMRYYYGTISPSNLSQILKQLANVHGDKFEGFIVGPSSTHAIQFNDMISNLASLEAGFSPTKLP